MFFQFGSIFFEEFLKIAFEDQRGVTGLKRGRFYLSSGYSGTKKKFSRSYRDSSSRLADVRDVAQIYLFKPEERGCFGTDDLSRIVPGHVDQLVEVQGDLKWNTDQIVLVECIKDLLLSESLIHVRVIIAEGLQDTCFKASGSHGLLDQFAVQFRIHTHAGIEFRSEWRRTAIDFKS